MQFKQRDIPKIGRGKYNTTHITYNGSMGGGSGSSDSGANMALENLEYQHKRDVEEINTRIDTEVETLQIQIDDLPTKFISKEYDDSTEGTITFNKGLIAKTTLGTLQLKRAVSGALTETGNTGIIEEGVVEEGAVATALIEASNATGGGASSLGELINVDDSADDAPAEARVLVQEAGKDVWTFKLLSELGGGSNTGIVMKLQKINEPSTAALGNDVIIQYSFTSIDTVDNTPTGKGKVTCSANGTKVYNAQIEQGTNAFNFGKHLVLGTNKMEIVVTDNYGTSRILSYEVEIVKIELTSTFDDSQLFTGSITYKYIPIGAVMKTIHFILDGIEIGTYETASTNRQQAYSIPAQSHAAHRLEVYMTAEVDGSNIQSNHLYYDLICVVNGNSTPIVASSFNTLEAEQYSTLLIPYTVYNPAATLADVELLVNDAVVSTLQVDRTKHNWSYRINNKGALKLTIRCGSVSKNFTVAVIDSTIDVGAETADLELFLTSMGRSNSETNKTEWKYNDINSTLTGFNFATDGWLTDTNNNVVLRVSNDARVNIPLKLFEKDLRTNGKTIEFEFSTSNVTDYDDVIISCWNNGKGLKITAQKATLTSTQTNVEVLFKEEERVRVSFTIEETAENRLVYTYINGVASGVIQYPVNDSFTQVTPAGITIGGTGCTVDVYNIRSYGNNLNQFQILNNYIADMDDIDLKLKLFESNNIYDSYGDIVYNRIVEQLPCMTIIGELPAYKGDKKKTTKIVYEDRKNPVNSWSGSNITNDVQGTSSQYYPRKNYKFKFDKAGITLTASDTKSTTYKLREDSIGVNCFCIKADFAESSGTHNTGLAKIIDTSLKKLDLLTPPQKNNSLVRTTIDGFPICVFHKETEESAVTFLGKYNFNNDKSTQNTFGFAGNAECWEFKNNTSERMLFKKSDYTELDDEGTPDWMNDFEARYPDDDDLNAEYAAGKIPVNLKRVTDWIVSTKDNTAKFKAEAANYFDIDTLLFYYLITELFGMVDQRAKNMFFATWDTEHWYPIFYDNDTCLGLNNEGDIVFNYNIEYHDTQGTQNVYNGASSVLWNNVEAAFEKEIATLYVKIRTQKVLTYEDIISVLNTEQSGRWCEAIYNADGTFKYISPLIDGFYDYGVNEFIHTGAFLYAMQGSRAEHRKWWLFNRFRYMDSKYNTGTYVSDYATMRLYTPSDWVGVKPDADFHLTPYADQYLKVKFGSYGTSSTRADKGVVTVIKAPSGQILNDTETIIYGASRLRSLGDLSAKYPSTIDVSRAVKLEELIVGSDAEGYRNTNLKTLSIGGNKMLKRVNIQNCPELKQPLDVSLCDNIEEIYTEGSGVSSIVLGSGGNLKVLHLPDSITSLNIKNQPKLLEEGFKIDGVSKLSSLVLENTNIDTFALLSKCFQESIYILERVRLIGVIGTTDSAELLAKLVRMGGVDEGGNDIGKAVVTGRCDVPVIYRTDYTILQETFPELFINYKYMCVKFPDPEMKRIMVNQLDTNFNKEVDESEAQQPREFPYWWRDNKVIISNEGIEYVNFISTDVNFGGYYSGQFRGCSNLRVARFPNNGNKKTWMAMYQDCTSLTDVKFNDGLEDINNGTFNGCTSLNKIELPVTLKRIGANTFQHTGFTELNTGDTVEEIGGFAFNSCANLRKLVIGNNCKTVGNYVAGYCPNLKVLDIGTGITSLGMTLCRDNPLTEAIIIRNPIPPTCGYAACEYCPALIYVPDEALEVYKTASYFSGIKNQLRGISQLPNFI